MLENAGFVDITMEYDGLNDGLGIITANKQ